MKIKCTLSLISLSFISVSVFASSPCKKFNGDAIHFLTNEDSVAYVPVDRESYVESGYIVESKLAKKFDRICVPGNIVIHTFSEPKLTDPNASYTIPEGTINQFSTNNAQGVKAFSFHNGAKNVVRWNGSKIIEQGQLSRYLNPHTDNVELFASKTSGYMEQFPVNGKSDNNWQMISQEKVVEAPLVITMGEKQTEAEQRAKDAHVSEIATQQEIIDSASYSIFKLVNGREGTGSNYGFTIRADLNELRGKRLVSTNFYEYRVTSKWGNYELDPRPINYSSYPQSDDNTTYDFTIISNARASVGDVIQIVGELAYSDGSVYIVRTNKIKLSY